MNISSKIMALSMTAMLMAGTAMAADLGSGISSMGSSAKSSATNTINSVKDSATNMMKPSDVKTNATGSANVNTGTSNVSGSSSTSADINAGANTKADNSSGSVSTNVSSGKNTMSGTQRVKSNMGLHRCGGNRGNGVGNNCSVSMTALDKNSNGSISRSEFRKGKLSGGLFRRIDKNHNGIISQSELSAYNSGKVGVTGTTRVKAKSR